MQSKTKVALCLSGEPRSTMASFPYIYESFLKPNPNYEVDVYVHSWKGFRALELYNPKVYSISHIDTYSYFTNFLNNLHLSSKEVIQKLSSYNSLTHNIHPLKNVFLMYSSIKECFYLIKEKYDFYIRCRLDLFLENKINLETYFELLKKNVDIIATVKKIPINNKLILDDQLAICNYKGFKSYCSIVDNLVELVNQSNSLQPEDLLATQFYNDKVSFFTTNLGHHLIKSSSIYSSYLNFKDE